MNPRLRHQTMPQDEMNGFAETSQRRHGDRAESIRLIRSSIDVNPIHAQGAFAA